MEQSAELRLAHAEAVARRWRRLVEKFAISDGCDEIFSQVLRCSVAADRAVERLREAADHS